MVTGIQTGGVDIDTLFRALETTKQSDVGWQSNGSVDISNRFEPYTTGTKVATTNLQSGGVDFADLFQNISVPIDQVDWTTSAQSITTVGAGEVHDITGIRLLSDGNAEKTNLNGTWVANSPDWGSPAGSVTGSNFEAAWVMVSGTTPEVTFGAQSTYFAISITRTLALSAGGTGGRTSVFDLTVGLIGDAGTRKTSRITLDQGSAP